MRLKAKVSGGTAGFVAGDQGGMTHIIVVLNLPVPDDRRVWAQAQAARDAGRDVVVICPAMRDYAVGTRESDGIRVRYFRAFEGKGLVSTAAEALWNTFVASYHASRELSNQPAVVQVCNPPDTLFPLLWISRHRGATCVYDHHDVAPAMALARPRFKGLARVFALLEKMTVRSADIVLTPSVEQQLRLRSLYGVEAVISRTAPLPPVQRANVVDGGAGPTVFGYIGVMGEQDGLGELVQAAHALRRLRGNVFQLQIAGDGPYLSDLKRKVAELDLGDVVCLRGWLREAELQKMLSAVDALVVPDPDSEYAHYCSMNKVTHAMASGVPVIGRPLRENMGMLGDLGIIASDFSIDGLADAMARFLDLARSDRLELSEALRERQREHLSWDVHRQRYLSATLSAPKRKSM